MLNRRGCPRLWKDVHAVKSPLNQAPLRPPLHHLQFEESSSFPVSSISVSGLPFNNRKFWKWNQRYLSLLSPLQTLKRAFFSVTKLIRGIKWWFSSKYSVEMNYEIFRIVAVLENQMPKQAGLVLHQIPLHTGSKLRQMPRLCSRGMSALKSDRDINHSRLHSQHSECWICHNFF